MKHKNIPYQKAPCADCPFRKDTLKGWLGKERMTEICQADSFVCHKRNDLQCAGHMTLLKTDNMFVRLMAVLGMQPIIKNQESIFESVEDCIAHHDNKNILKIKPK